MGLLELSSGIGRPCSAGEPGLEAGGGRERERGGKQAAGREDRAF